MKSKSGQDIFGDLLGSQGYSFTSSKSSSGPRTINEMRKEEMVKEMDPDKLKVRIYIHYSCLNLVNNLFLIRKQNYIFHQ